MSTQQFLLPAPHTATAQNSHTRLLYVTRAQYSPEWNSTPHTHGCTELFFITGGHGMFQAQQARFPVAINDLVVINANVLHCETSQQSHPMEYVVLGVEGLETYADIGGYALMHLQTEQDSVSSCLRLMLQECQREQEGYDRICQHLLEAILLQLVRRDDFSLSAAPSGSKSSKECGLVRQYIDNHFKENITLDQLAAMVHINKYYLSHAFRREFDTSPISYLIERRIEESHFLLLETDHSISQIAQILGFSSLSYFSQSFRRLEGISPIEFRRRHRKKDSELGS